MLLIIQALRLRELSDHCKNLNHQKNALVCVVEKLIGITRDRRGP